MKNPVIKLAICATILLGTNLALRAEVAKAAPANAQQPSSDNLTACSGGECAEKEKTFVGKLSEVNQKLFNGFNKDQKVAALSMAGYGQGKVADAKTMTPDEAVQKVATTK